MAKPFFIAGAGTDIGKTFITTALCWQLRQKGKQVTALKPVITGFDPNDALSDTALILQSCGLAPTPETMRAISPWRFKAPLSPDMAAAGEGKSILLQEVIDFCAEHADLQSDLVLAEGAGGIMSPLGETYTALDLIEALRWPLILVAGSYLGSLSHTLTALEAVRARNLRVAALVVNESEKRDVPLDDTVATLTRLVPADIPVVKLPRFRVQAEMWKHLPPIDWICA